MSKSKQCQLAFENTFKGWGSWCNQTFGGAFDVGKLFSQVHRQEKLDFEPRCEHVNLN